MATLQPFPDVIGHQNQIAMLQRAMGRNRLAHAFLFVGSRGIGKRQVAFSFAKTLLCESSFETKLSPCGQCKSCHLFSKDGHPDFFYVKRPEGKTDLPIELLVGARDDRNKGGLLGELSLKPMRGERRIAIVDDAETMNEASSNALLKTLEEPPASAMIILICAQIEKILPTIRSRTQMLCFGELLPGELKQILASTYNEIGMNQEEIPRHIPDVGSLEKVMQYQEAGYLTLTEIVKNRIFESPFDPVHTFYLLKEELQNIGGDTVQQRDSLRFVLEEMGKRCRELILLLTEEALNRGIRAQEVKHRSRWNVDSLADAIERILEAQLDLNTSMSVPLCLESLLYALSNIQRMHQSS